MTAQPIYTRAAVTTISGRRVEVAEDTAAQQVAELVAQGVDQLTASRQVYGAPPAWDAPRHEWSYWIRQHVTNLFAPLWALVDRIDTKYANALNPPEES